MVRSIDTENNLLPFLLNEILSFSGDGILIHAGHFTLDTSTSGLLSDHLDPGPGNAQGLIGDFLRFTEATWRLGCDLAAKGNRAGLPVSLMALVNDWQFVAGSGNSRRNREQNAEGQRREYYTSVPKLPDFHLRTMAEFGLSEDVIWRSREERWLFSESELRRGLARMISSLFRDGTAEMRGLSQEIATNGDLMVKIRSELYSEACLLYCGSTNCSGEIVALLKILHDRGSRLFINMYPVQCLGPVSAGTEMARQIFGLGGIRIINVAFPLGPSGSNPSAVVDTGV